MASKTKKLPFRRASMTTRLYGLILAKDKILSTWCFGLLYLDQDVGIDFVKRIVTSNFVEKMPRFRSTYSAKKKGYSEIPIESLDWTYHLAHVTETISVDDICNSYIGDIYSQFKLDATKPLWRFVYFSKLADGRSCIMSCINHAMGDGIAQIELLFQLMDKTPEIPNPNQESLEHKIETIGITEDSEALSPEETKLQAEKSSNKQEGTDYKNVKTVRKLKNSYGPLNKGFIFVGGVLSALASAFANPDSAGPLKMKFRTLPAEKRSIAFTPTISLEKVKELKAKYENATVNDILVSLLTMTLTKYLSSVPGGKPFISGKKKFRACFPINIRSPGENAFDKYNSPHNRIALGIFSFPLNFKSRTQLVYLVKRKLDRIKLSPMPYVQKSVGDILIKLMTRNFAAQFFFEFQSQASGMLSNVMGPQKQAKIEGFNVVDMQFALYLPVSLYMGLISYDNRVSCSVCLDGNLGNAESLTKYWIEEFETLYEETMKIKTDFVPNKKGVKGFFEKF